MRCQIALAVLALLNSTAGAQSWTPQNPDTTGAIDFGGAFATSEQGVIIGFAHFPGNGSGPAYWNATGTHSLPILAGDDQGIAVEINDLGQAVGTSTDVEDTPTLTFFFDHPVWWRQGVATDLRTLVAGGDALELLTSADVNNAEQIIGHARVEGGSTGLRGFLFEDGIVTDLGDLNPGGYASTEVATISEDGTIVGSSTAPTTFMHAFRWKDGVMTDLHDFAQMPGRNSHALDINSQGVIVGSGDFLGDFNDYETGALFDHGTITNLGSLAPGEVWAQAFALGINDLNQIVGATNLPSGEPRAFLWQDGVMSDLNSFLVPGSGWTLTSAEDITNDGRIVGQALFQGMLLPFLLVPNCAGGYTPYAAGCGGTGGFVPALFGVGCPAPGQPVGLAIEGGLGGAPGAIAIGLGAGPFPITPACSASIAPLTSIILPFVLSGAGAGAGEHFELLAIPPSLPPATVNAQAAFLDFGVPHAISASNALGISIQ